MQGVRFMQLLILLALMLLGGNKGAGNILEEVKPVLESFGGEDIQKALKSAEELSSVLSAVQAVASPPSAPAQSAEQTYEPFPLAPVSKIADRDITYSLSRYFAQT